MNRNETAQCNNCPYWFGGDCRRLSPGSDGAFPHTPHDYWCGEHPDLFKPQEITLDASKVDLAKLAATDEAKCLTLEDHRLRKGVSYREIARDLDMSECSVRSHHQSHRVPKIKTALLYAQYYCCTPESILASFTSTIRVQSRGKHPDFPHVDTLDSIAKGEEQATGLTLHDYRRKKGVTMMQVARKLGISYQAVKNHHNGHMPNARTALAYAKYYGCSAQAILNSYANAKGGKS